MKHMSLLLLLAWGYLLVFHVDGAGSHPSLRQLIAESKKELSGERYMVGSPVKFHPVSVRKNFFGDEEKFLEAVAALLLEGNDADVWDAYNIVLFLDIDDRGIFEILREKFVSEKLDQVFQLQLIFLLSRHPHQENIDFLVAILQQSDHLPAFHIAAATSLTEAKIFENFSDEQKESLLKVFFSHLDDEREFFVQYSPCPTKVGDKIASLLGNFEKHAAAALSAIKKKFNSINEMDVCSVENKLRLAWAIVRIVSNQCNEFEYILHEAINNESERVRWVAIDLLETTPSPLLEKAISCLITVIQEDTSISNKRRAVESIKTIMAKQE